MRPEGGGAQSLVRRVSPIRLYLIFSVPQHLFSALHVLAAWFLVGAITRALAVGAMYAVAVLAAIAAIVAPVIIHWR